MVYFKYVMGKINVKYALEIALIIALVIVIDVRNNNKSNNIQKQAIKQQKVLIEDIEKRIDKLQAGISQDNKRRWNILGVEKYIEHINGKIPYEKRHNYATFIVNEAEHYVNLDISLIVSVIKQESHFNTSAKSDADAFGLMGIIEETGRWICKELGIYYKDGILANPEMNIKMGCWFLNYLKEKYQSEELMLAHYNGGSRQKNRYINYRKLKNRKDYNISIADIKTNMEKLKDSTGVIVNEDKYDYLKNMVSAKKLSPETKDYIPMVLTRRREIKNFLTDPDIFIKIAVKDTTGDIS